MSQEQSVKYQATIQATLELVAEQGFHGTPMSQVAKQAGVGVGSIYRYFKDKDELIHAVHAQVESRMLEAITELHVPAKSKKEKFFNLAISLAKHFVANPLEFKFMEQYYNSPYGIEKKRQKFVNESNADPCANVVLEIISGEGVKEYPTPLLHSLAFGPLLFSIRDHLSGLLVLDDAIIQQLAEGCWDAISKK